MACSLPAQPAWAAASASRTPHPHSLLFCHPSTRPNSPAVCGSVEQDIAFTGGDLLQVAVSKGEALEECRTACAAQAGCAAFSVLERSCALKDIAGWQREAAPGAQSVVICPKPFPTADISPSPPAPARCVCLCALRQAAAGWHGFSLHCAFCPWHMTEF